MEPGQYLEGAVEQVADLLNKAEEIKKSVKGMLEPLFKDFFQKNPNIKCIAWTQYTPYFMDGDPCEFSMNEPEAFYKSWEELQNDENDGLCLEEYPGNIVEWGDTDYIRHPGADEFDEFKHLLNKLEDIFRAAYGDHIMVIVEPHGITIEEFDHS